MIWKKNRLKVKETKKVLRFWKPFFSYTIIIKVIKNNNNFNRFAIILSWKNTKTAVTRNYFRRLYYNTSSDYLNVLKNNSWYDIVLLLKKWNTLEQNSECVLKFKKELTWSLNKLLK